MSESPREFPWQHEIFADLSKILRCKLHISTVDGVLIIRDQKAGLDIFENRTSIVRYLRHVFSGLEDVFILVDQESCWSAIDTREDYEEPPVIPLTETSLAGALASVHYMNSDKKVWSRWAH